MGSCISRSPASASASGSSGRRAATAKVVGLNGSMAQHAAPVTAREALGGDGARASVFLCSSDELRFDVPPRALEGEETLQPGWLYFVLPVSMLRLALSGHEMAALAVRASSALAEASGVESPPRRKTVAGGNGRQWKTARVAPLAALDNDEDSELAYGGWNQHGYGKYGGARKTVHGDGEPAGKTRKRATDVQRLSAILEADEF